MLWDGCFSCYLSWAKQRLRWRGRDGARLAQPLGELFHGLHNSRSSSEPALGRTPTLYSCVAKDEFCYSNFKSRWVENLGRFLPHGWDRRAGSRPLGTLPLDQQSSGACSDGFTTSRAQRSLNFTAGSWNDPKLGGCSPVSVECSSCCHCPWADVSILIPSSPCIPQA